MKGRFLIFIWVLACNFKAMDVKVSPLLEGVQATVSEFENERRFSGSVLVAQGNQVIFMKGIGMANHSYQIPNRPDTAFLVGSISKQFTSMIILQLVQEGKLKLSDTIGKWFPNFPAYKADTITIHHLLSHSSGLPHYGGLVELGVDLEHYGRVNRPLEEYAKTIGNMNLLWPPGTKFRYSSQGYILLGVIAQKVAKKSFGELIKSRIASPLNLKNTGFAFNKEIVSDLAAAYTYGILETDESNLKMGFTNSEYRDQTNSFCTGGVHSTVEDLFVWSQSLWTDKLLGRELREKMFSKQADPYGYGWFISNPNDWGLDEKTHILNHGGATTGYRAQIAILDKGAFTVIVLANTVESRSTTLARSIARVLYHKNPIPANILGTALAWRLVSEGSQSTKSFFEKEEGHQFKNYLNNDYAFHLYCDQFLDLGKPEMARQLVSYGLKANPDAGSLYISLGDIAAYQKQVLEAERYYQKAIELAKKIPEVNRNVIENAQNKLNKL